MEKFIDVLTLLAEVDQKHFCFAGKRPRKSSTRSLRWLNVYGNVFQQAFEKVFSPP